MQRSKSPPREHHKFSALHRYYAWSLILREQFYAPFADFAASEDMERGLALWIGQVGDARIGPGAVLMSHWYASLYVVIEGWQQLGFHDPVIDALIASEHTEQLRRHRNATCHFHKTLSVEKWEEFEREPDSVKWVRALDHEFGRYFLEETERYAAQVLASDAPVMAKELAKNFLIFIQKYPRT